MVSWCKGVQGNVKRYRYTVDVGCLILTFTNTVKVSSSTFLVLVPRGQWYTSLRRVGHPYGSDLK